MKDIPLSFLPSDLSLPLQGAEKCVRSALLITQCQERPDILPHREIPALLTSLPLADFFTTDFFLSLISDPSIPSLYLLEVP